ncbi:hypothetical protein BDP27DRAFT_1481713, partial [Rhodocollybia butyracea]
EVGSCAKDTFTKPGTINVYLEGSIQGFPISWDLSLPISFPSQWNYIQMLNAMFDALPCMKGIAELSLVYCKFAYEQLISLFHKMQNVETLSISNIGDQLLDSIPDAPDTTMLVNKGGTFRDSVFFPCLKGISVDRGNSTLFPQLRKCLNNRKQRGSVQVCGCGESGILG